MTVGKQKILTIAGLLILLVLVVPLKSHAAGLVPCGNTVGTGPDNHPCGVLDVFYLIARTTNWLLMVAGLYAVYQLVNAGFWLVVTMGNEESITKYRSMATNAVVGFVFTMLAFVFVNTAVNAIMQSKCKLDLTSPWTYIAPTDPNGTSCVANPVK